MDLKKTSLSLMIAVGLSTLPACGVEEGVGGGSAAEPVLAGYDRQGAASVYGFPTIDAFTIQEPLGADRLKGDETSLVTGDFNGDGRTDFLRQERNTWDDDSRNTAEVWLSNGDGTFTIVETNDSDSLKGDLTNVYPGDFNGDGRTDFLRQEKNAWDDDSVRTAETWLSNGDGTFSVVGTNDADKLKGDLTNIIPGDFNGDGLTDFLRQEKNAWDDDSANTAEVWLSNGHGAFLILELSNADRLKGDETNLIPGDFNGDRRMDFLRQEKNNWDNDPGYTAEVWLSNGNATFTVIEPLGADRLKGDESNIIPGDFNGDRRTDFLRQEKNNWDNDSGQTAEVWLSNGSGTFTVIEPSSADMLKGDLTNIIPGDFNGDGRADFLRQEKSAWDDDSASTAGVWLSNGDGSFTILEPTGADRLKGDLTNAIPGDFNGDGRTDFLRQEKNAWDDDSANTAEVWLSKL